LDRREREQINRQIESGTVATKTLHGIPTTAASTCGSYRQFPEFLTECGVYSTYAEMEAARAELKAAATSRIAQELGASVDALPQEAVRLLIQFERKLIDESTLVSLVVGEISSLEVTCNELQKENIALAVRVEKLEAVEHQHPLTKETAQPVFATYEVLGLELRGLCALTILNLFFWMVVAYFY
jgi:hypothetical protein